MTFTILIGINISNLKSMLPKQKLCLHGTSQHIFSGGEFEFSLVDKENKVISLGQNCGLLLANRAGSSQV